jgi:group I intron endonuclease
VSETTFIYALVDPETLEIRYVGKSDNPTRRLKVHLAICQTKKLHIAHWLRSLKIRGLIPEIKILQEVTSETWQEAERCWINRLRDQGCNLTNIAQGGIGGQSGKRHSAEHKLYMSQLMKGRFISEEHRKKISLSKIGKKRPPEVVKKVADAKRGKKASVETRRKIAIAQQGRWTNDERKKQAERARAQWARRKSNSCGQLSLF